MVGAEELTSDKEQLKGVAACQMDDVINQNWRIKIYNCQAMLKVVTVTFTKMGYVFGCISIFCYISPNNSISILITAVFSQYSCTFSKINGKKQYVGSQ